MFIRGKTRQWGVLTVWIGQNLSETGPRFGIDRVQATIGLSDVVLFSETAGDCSDTCTNTTVSTRAHKHTDRGRERVVEVTGRHNMKSYLH